jgi:hypothetical protein
MSKLSQLGRETQGGMKKLSYEKEVAKTIEYLEKHGIEVLKVEPLENETRIYIRKKEESFIRKGIVTGASVQKVREEIERAKKGA